MAGTKAAAESILRELPSVMGTFVKEDVHGNPREIHLLIRPGPSPRDLSRDIQGLLEERLGIAIDRRVISIAQVAEEGADGMAGPDARDRAERPKLTVLPAGDTSRNGEPRRPDGGRREAHGHRIGGFGNGRVAARAQARGRRTTGEPGGRRPILAGIETRREAGSVVVRLTMTCDGRDIIAECSEPDTGTGAFRAAARAALDALLAAPGHDLRLALEGVTLENALGRAMVLATVVAWGAESGWRPRILSGAHPLGERPETAAVLAVLKALDRTVEVGAGAGSVAVG